MYINTFNLSFSPTIKRGGIMKPLHTSKRPHTLGQYRVRIHEYETDNETPCTHRVLPSIVYRIY